MSLSQSTRPIGRKMAKSVILKLPPQLEEEDVPDFVSTTIDSLYDALNTEIKSETRCAALKDITVTSVALSDDDIAVNYNVAIDSHQAWERGDLPQGSIDRLIVGKRQGRSLIFDRFVPSFFRSKH